MGAPIPRSLYLLIHLHCAGGVALVDATALSQLLLPAFLAGHVHALDRRLARRLGVADLEDVEADFAGGDARGRDDAVGE